MNRLVNSWNKQASRQRYDGPDTVVVDERTAQLEEEATMAERKSPQTAAVQDNSALIADPKRDHSKVVHAMTSDKLNNVIRAVLMGTLERALAIRTATHQNMKRLGVKRNTKVAAKKIPKGSNQFDTGTLVTWLAAICPGDKNSIKQLVKIDATCCTRG